MRKQRRSHQNRVETKAAPRSSPRRRLFAQNLEDIHGTALLLEVADAPPRTKRGTQPLPSLTISNAYVAAITYRVLGEYVRKKEPWRASLEEEAPLSVESRTGFRDMAAMPMSSGPCGLLHRGETGRTSPKNSALRTLLDNLSEVVFRCA